MADEGAVASSQIDRSAVGRAVDSLLKWFRAHSAAQKSQLFEQDEPLRLILSLRKIPAKGRTNPYLIPLPHPLLPSSAEICLIADDRPSAPETLAAVQQRILSEGIPISEVIPLASLKSDYKPYESRRKLRGSFDFFVADRRIIPLLPRLIGNSFFKKKKHPLPIDLSRKGWPEQLKKCLNSATLYIRTGTCCQLDVGRASQNREEIIDNVIEAVNGALGKIPKKWDNVRSIHLKFDESVALPVYRALPEMGFKIETYQKPLIKEQELPEKKKKIKKIDDDEREIKKGSSRKIRYMDADFERREDEEELKVEEGSKKRKKGNPNLSKEAKKKKIKKVSADSVETKKILKKKIKQ